MASIASSLSTGQIAVQVQELGAGDVRQAIRAFTCLDVAQVVAAVDDDERRIVPMQREIGWWI